jgi:hypothetical protein
VPVQSATLKAVPSATRVNAVSAMPAQPQAVQAKLTTTASSVAPVQAQTVHIASTPQAVHVASSVSSPQAAPVKAPASSDTAPAPVAAAAAPSAIIAAPVAIHALAHRADVIAPVQAPPSYAQNAPKVIRFTPEPVTAKPSAVKVQAVPQGHAASPVVVKPAKLVTSTLKPVDHFARPLKARAFMSPKPVVQPEASAKIMVAPASSVAKNLNTTGISIINTSGSHTKALPAIPEGISRVGAVPEAPAAGEKSITNFTQASQQKIHATAKAIHVMNQSLLVNLKEDSDHYPYLDVGAPFDTVWVRTQDALKHTNYDTVSTDKKSGYIFIAPFGTDDVAKNTSLLSVTKVSLDESEVTLFNTKGNESRAPWAQNLLQKIEKNLVK